MEGELKLNLCLLRLAQNPEKSSSLRELELPYDTRVVLDVKRYIENEFSIPVCVQTLRLASAVLRDDTPLSSLRLRSGDTLHVSYYAAAECEQLRYVIHWLERLVSSLREEGVPSRRNFSERRRSAVTGDNLLVHLGRLFLPWGSPEKRANKLFFVQNGGLELMLQLFSLLLTQPWTEMPLQLKRIEYKLLSTLWNLCETYKIRHEVLRRGGLSMCLQSLLQVEVRSGEPIVDKSLCASAEKHLHSMNLQSTLICALGLLSM